MFVDTPVVTAVRGWAGGDAFSWPVNCDVSVWSEDAQAFFPELKIGLYLSGPVIFLARVVDARDRPVPAGVPGELVLRGVGLMDGYYRNPAATAEAFRNGWLHTGDVVRCDERGRYHYVSRRKDVIRRGGENIAAAEVEEVIMRHPGVRLAAVLAVEDDLRGEEVMAYVVPGDGVSPGEASPAVLAAFCAERLARFKVPRYWQYRDDLPRTPSERVRKEALRDEHEEPDRRRLGSGRRTLEMGDALREEHETPTTGAWSRVDARRR